MRRLKVRLTRTAGDEPIVGILAESDRRIYFEWDSEYLNDGVELSPFKLPFTPQLHEHRDLAFGPLPGLFEESLPDGWGRLLMDRHFRREGLDVATVSPMDRLAYLGTRTMGALAYHPAAEEEPAENQLDLFELGHHAERVFAGTAVDVLPQLIQAGGSPGGARPKVLVGLRGEDVVSGESKLPDGFEYWMVKFATQKDAAYAGPLERAYALMAGAAGIPMPTTRLFEVKKNRNTRRYFGVRRFDRGTGSRRFHVQTFANLIHVDFRVPTSDYSDLLKVTRVLTRNHADVLRAFRQMVFNVAAHVRDDHTKNFAFLVNRNHEWCLTPAYDLTFSPGPGGEHTMSVAGEGRSPSREHCLAVAKTAGVSETKASAAMDVVNESISRWAEFAEEACCSRAVTQRVAGALRSL